MKSNVRAVIRYEVCGEAPAFTLLRHVNEGEPEVVTRLGSKAHFTSSHAVSQALASALRADVAACTRLGLNAVVGAWGIEVH